MQRRGRKALAGFVASVYFVANVPLAHAAESNFWAERRRQAESQKAPAGPLMASAALPSDPAQVLKDLPSVGSQQLGQLTPALAEQLEKEAAPDSARRIADILRSLPLSYGSVRKVSPGP